MESLFEANAEIESRILRESPKPDFKYLFLSHYTEKELQDLWDYIENSTLEHHVFLKALYHEYGVHPLKQPDIKEAFNLYLKGSDLRECYCCFRLHFVYKNEFELFSVTKDRALEMLYLIKAAAYFDEKDNRLNRKYLDPVMHLAVHLDNEDPDLIKTVELLDKYKNFDKKNEMIGGFLQNWCCIRFSLSDHTKTECLNHLITLAE
jgi:hypothetical protein